MAKFARATSALCLVCGLWPSVGHAGIIPILEVALELWQAIPNAAPPVGNASASVSLDGNPALHSLSQSFSGRANASASVDIDRFRETSAASDVSWLYVFRVDQPGIVNFLINQTYGVSTSVYTNFNANSRANATVGGLSATADIAEFHLATSWSDLTRSGNCSSSGLFDDCGPNANAAALAADHYLSYSPGFPVGTLIALSGLLDVNAFGHTGAGSAESSASANATFSIRAVPLPSTLSLLLVAMLMLFGVRKGSWAPRSVQ